MKTKTTDLTTALNAETQFLRAYGAETRALEQNAPSTHKRRKALRRAIQTLASETGRDKETGRIVAVLTAMIREL